MLKQHRGMEYLASDLFSIRIAGGAAGTFCTGRNVVVLAVAMVGKTSELDITLKLHKQAGMAQILPFKGHLTQTNRKTETTGRLQSLRTRAQGFQRQCKRRGTSLLHCRMFARQQEDTGVNGTWKIMCSD